MTKKLIKNLGIPVVLLFAAIFWCVPNASAIASLNTTVHVGASVVSKVSKIKSTVTLSASQTIADPEHNPVLLTINLQDEDGNPLPDIITDVSSTRGSVDIIEMFSGSGQDLIDTSSGKTDADGNIRFRLSSYTPGMATFNILVDTVVDLPSQTVEFISLPFPGNIEVNVPLPPAVSKIIGKSGKDGDKIVIIPQAETSQPTTPSREGAQKVTFVVTELSIPFSIFILVCIISIVLPILVIINLILSTRSRRYEKREMALLEEIARAEHVDQIKYYVENKH